MNISFLRKPLDILPLLVLVFSIISKIDYNAVDAAQAQVYVTKSFNPYYKTEYEVEEEKAKEKAKGIADEISKESADKRKMSALVDIKMVEGVLRKKGLIFRVGHSGNFYVLDNFVWVCGNLLYKKNSIRNYYCPAVVISEDGGNDYRLSKVFKELSQAGNALCSSNILFLEKNNGWLSIRGPFYGNMVYKTSDGGYNWDAVLNIKNISSSGLYVKRIMVTNNNICLIASLRGEGFPKSVESNDDGKTWISKRGDREVAITFNRGLTWEAVKKNNATILEN